MHPAPTNALEVLKSIEVVDLQHVSGLRLFGLKGAGESSLDYATLDEALEQQVLEITEVSESGQVPTIKVRNKSKKMVFMMSGDILVGCKQDRVLTTSIMVPADTELPIPVACVEAGRWGYRSQRFRSGSSSSHSSLRMMLSRQSSASYRTRGTAGSDQGAVWAEVDRKIRAMGSKSPSSALHDMFAQQAARLDDFVSKCAAPEGCSGVAAALGDRIIGADFFDNPETLKKAWPRLIKSYAADALEEPGEERASLSAGQVAEWLRAASAAKQEKFPSPGVGQDIRIEGEQLVGAALIVAEQPVHLGLFNAPPAQPESF